MNSSRHDALLATKTGRISPLLNHLSSLPEPVIYLIGIVAGLIGVGSFSPFHLWPAYFITIVVYGLLVMTSPTAKVACYRGSSVALGFFSGGVSWVFVSISEYGQVGNIIAVVITLGFIAVLTLFWSFSAWLGWHLSRKIPQLPSSFAIGLGLLIGEYLRSHLFTGFPWLLPGYAIQDTWLFELLPIGGIWFASALVILTSVSLATLLARQANHWSVWLTVLSLWGLAATLHFSPIQWVSPVGELKATLIQGNVSQDEKWLSQTARTSLAEYQQNTIEHLDSDLVIWPETAITYLYPQIRPHLESFIEELSQSNTSLITGIPDKNTETGQYYNAIWATGNGFGLYYKQRLVPFGEYIPLASFIGPILDIFNMPIAGFLPGEANQPVLQVGEWAAAPFICYEIVYSEQVRNMVRDSDFLVTISNDAWFGASIGPWQHLQIAQFRAKESGRFVLRATNTGVTAVINERGEIHAQAPQFEKTSLTSQVRLYNGTTPYVQWGNHMTLALLALIGFLCLLAPSKKANKTAPKN